MNILLTGGTGLIGQELGKALVQAGHNLTVVTRSPATARINLQYKCELVECNLATHPLDISYFQDIDVIINMAGETIDGRWTNKKKKQIIESRVQIASNLLKYCPSTVATILTASALGFYGDRGDEELTEDSELGTGFLAEVCEAWENPFRNITKQRVVILRIGIVLSKKGGALNKMIKIFQYNLGATLGSGKQWMSWISLNDLVRLVTFSIDNQELRGVINAVNNEPTQNHQFTQLLAQNLKVVQLPAVPKFVLKIILGEMSSLVLSSAKVFSRKLKKINFKFKDTNLNEFLKNELSLNIADQ